MGSIVAGQFITYLNGGTEVSERLGVNVQIPVTVFQYGEDNFAQEVDPIDTAPVALHDIRLDVRLRLYSTDNRRFQLGLHAAGFIPSGQAQSFAGDDSASWLLGVAGEYTFSNDFLLAMMAGPHFRPTRGIDLTDGTTYLSVGNEIRYALGGYLPLRDEKIRLGLEIWGSTGVGDVRGNDTTLAGRNTDIEWLAQARFLLGDSDPQQTWLMAGGGTRLSGGYGAPDLR